MLTKNSLSAADWNTLRDVPYLVGFATLVSGWSGFGTVKESIEIARGMVEGQSSDVALVRELTNTAEVQDAQRSVRDTLGADAATISKNKDRLRALVLERVAATMSILDAKASPEESSAVRRWIYGIAERVANAAKEGGFLGVGGTRVSEEEQDFLTELRRALQLQVGTA